MNIRNISLTLCTLLSIYYRIYSLDIDKYIKVMCVCEYVGTKVLFNENN